MPCCHTLALVLLASVSALCRFQSSSAASTHETPITKVSGTAVNGTPFVLDVNGIACSVATMRK